IQKMRPSEVRVASSDSGGARPGSLEQLGRIDTVEAERKPSSCLPPATQRILEAQLAMVQQGISPGSLDGVLGSQTRAALNAWCRKEGRTLGSESNIIAQLRGSLSGGLLVSYLITSNDLARLLPLGTTWLAKSQQERLDYETILEWFAER